VDASLQTTACLAESIGACMSIPSEQVKLYVRCQEQDTSGVEFGLLPLPSALAKVQRVLAGEVDALPKEGAAHVLYIMLESSAQLGPSAASTASAAGAPSSKKKGRKPALPWHQTARDLAVKHGPRDDDGLLRCAGSLRAGGADDGQRRLTTARTGTRC
jgi:hypothetical protein